MIPPREVVPYLSQRQGAPSGSIGKRGYLRMAFELDDQGRSILRDLERHTPIVAQQELYFDEQMPSMPCVYILSSGGPNVDGDRYEHHFTVRRNAFAHISTGAATKLAEMRYDYSSLSQHFEIEEGAYLEYLPEPTIPCRHTRYVARTRIVIDHSATLFFSEIYHSGRRHMSSEERFAYDILSIETSAARPNGGELFVEKMIIEPEKINPNSIARMGDFELLGNCFLIAPEPISNSVYEQVRPSIDRARPLSISVSCLPSQCGLAFRVMGNDTGEVKNQIRDLCSIVRHEVKGVKLPAEFPWR